MNKLLRDRTVWLTLVVLALGAALHVRDGLYSPIAVALLFVAIVFAFAGLFVDSDVIDPFAATRRTLQTIINLSLFAFLVGGALMLRSTPNPFMDVFVFQRDACAAMLNGTNPYTITYPNIYAGAGSFVYDPTLVCGDRLLFGFPYMPLTLWCDLLGTGLGDYRYANLLAVAFAAASLGSARLTVRSVLAALLLLAMSRSFFILENGWTEPLSVALLAATGVAALRARPALPYLFGLLLASKQYMVLAIPLVALLVDWRDWRFHLKAIGTAAVVTLPLALWNFRAFWDNAVLLQFRQPFRDDALSFAALLARHGFPRLPTIVPVMLALTVSLICVRRLPRSPHSFALAVALTFLAFFAFNKQAFANYYFFVIAALCCAIASFKPETPIVR
jgi:hypothetical protein